MRKIVDLERLRFVPEAWMDRNDAAYRGQSDYSPALLRLYEGRAFLWAFNRRGAFGNLDDTEAGLRDILGRSFYSVELKTVGGIAVFVARSPMGDLPANVD